VQFQLESAWDQSINQSIKRIDEQNLLRNKNKKKGNPSLVPLDPISHLEQTKIQTIDRFIINNNNDTKSIKNYSRRSEGMSRASRGFGMW
jgi:hypothetical protein